MGMEFCVQWVLTSSPVPRFFFLLGVRINVFQGMDLGEQTLFRLFEHALRENGKLSHTVKRVRLSIGVPRYGTIVPSANLLFDFMPLMRGPTRRTENDILSFFYNGNSVC